MRYAIFGKLVPYAIMAVVSGIALWREAPYASILFIASMASWYTIRLWLTDSQALEVTQETRRGRERALASMVGIGMVVIPLLALATPLLDFAAYPAMLSQYILGGVIWTTGSFVFYCSHRDLGAFWSAHLELRKGHALVTSGIYSRMRHPMYTAFFLITLSQALLLTNWIAGPSGFVLFALLYALRVGPEEQMMADQLGSEWADYANRTPRLLPRLRTA